MSIHEGHRKRIKERFRNEGLSFFNEHEILELLLCYCVPRCDVNETAHLLIDRFGTVGQVIQAPENELLKVEGVGKNITTFLALLNETHRHILVCESKKQRTLKSIADYASYLQKRFEGVHNEVAYLLCMDGKGTVIDCVMISEGSVNSTNISVRRVLDVAISNNAITAVLAHNHPGGLLVPSKEDVITTRYVAKALRMADVMLTDHIIISGRDYISMYQANMYRPNDLSDD